MNFTDRSFFNNFFILLALVFFTASGFFIFLEKAMAAPPVFSITVASKGSTGAVINGCNLQMLATVSPSNANQLVTWSIEPGTGTASIGSSTGLLSTTSPSNASLGAVTVKATAQDESGVAGEDTITIVAGATVNVGDGPFAIAVNSITNKIYVVSTSDNTVTVINGADNTTATISVAVGTLWTMAVNSTNNKIYAANYDDNTVTVINGANNTTATVSVGSRPLSIALNSVTNKIYTANTSDDTVTVINGADNTTATISVGDGPSAIAVNSTTNKIYVANYNADTVTVINGEDNTTATVSVGDAPGAIAVNSTTNKIYVANYDGDTVTIINGANNTTATVSVGDAPGFDDPKIIAVNSVTNKIYVASTSDNTVTVINGVDNTTATVAVGDDPESIAVNPVTNKIYAANYDDDTVTVINGADNTTVAISAGRAPYGITVNSATNKIYMADSASDTVAVLNEGAQATGITVSGAGGASTLLIGSDLQMLAAVSPSGAYQTVAWSVANETGTATIGSSSGLLAAITAGTVTVTATAQDGSGITGTKQITLTAPVVASSGGGGGGGGGGGFAPTVLAGPAGGFKILINNGYALTNSRDVVLTFVASPDIKNMVVSENINFLASLTQTYLSPFHYTLSDGAGSKTVYAKFYNLSGQSSVPVYAVINYNPAATATEIKNSERPAAVAVSGGSLVFCSGITFNRVLAVGFAGLDVKCLQVILNQSPATRVAVTGAGSPGAETTTFGLKTLSAVRAYQAANGLAPAQRVGFQTLALLNKYLSGITEPASVPVASNHQDTDNSALIAQLQAQIVQLQAQIAQILAQRQSR